MNKDYAVIILDSHDRSGKDTLRRHIIKESKGKYLVIVRAFISQVVYSRIYDRNINEDYFIDQAIKSQNLGYSFVVLKTDIDLVKKRIIDTNEQDVDIYQIESHIKTFQEVFNLFKSKGLKLLEIDSTDQDLDRMFNEIKSFIQLKL
jgi:hypothetical protein